MLKYWNYGIMIFAGMTGTHLISSFRQKPESSKFDRFWMPDQVRHDGFGTFYETVNNGFRENELQRF